jgi:uncharacterized protein
MFSLRIDRPSFKKIFKDSTSLLSFDASVGALTWALAFPTAVVVEQISDLFIFFFFHVESYNQTAVLYLKMMMNTPGLLALALTTILIFAPLLEEFLFRGILQTYLKKHFSQKVAIVISSLCFALFHLAPSQGAGNIPLFFSLMTLGLFLGFLYEKQRSLFAPIALHVTFNSISSFYILIFS